MNVHGEIAKCLEEIRGLGIYQWVEVTFTVPEKNRTYQVKEVYPCLPDEEHIQHWSRDPFATLQFLKDVILVEGVIRNAS